MVAESATRNDMNTSTKACPYCGEEILAVAIKCKHCQSMLSESQADRTASPQPSAGRPTLLTVAAVATTAQPTAASPTGGARKFIVAGVLMFVFALMAGAFMNGIVASMQDEQLAREYGYGLTGRDIRELRSWYGADRPWTGIAWLSFFGVWGIGTWLVGRSKVMGKACGHRQEDRDSVPLDENGRAEFQREKAADEMRPIWVIEQEMKQLKRQQAAK
jgi:hypothetical protein